MPAVFSSTPTLPELRLRVEQVAQVPERASVFLDCNDSTVLHVACLTFEQLIQFRDALAEAILRKHDADNARDEQWPEPDDPQVAAAAEAYLATVPQL